MKKIKLFFVYSPGDTDFPFIKEMHDLSTRLKLHENVVFMKYPKFEPEDLDDKESLDVKTYITIEKNILECNLLVAIGTHGSTGLGVEIALANQSRKSLMLCYADSLPKESISKVATGSLVRNPNARVVIYTSMEDLYQQIIEQVVRV